MIEGTPNSEPDRLRKAAESVPPIYPALARHQRDESWEHHDTMVLLQRWGGLFDVDFNLHLGKVTLRIEKLPVSCLGKYCKRNGLGLEGEVTINARYLNGSVALFFVLGTLLHLLLHVWQDAHGEPGLANHHNAEYRDKAAVLGLMVDERGATSYAADSLFKDLLRKHEVEVPDGEVAPLERVRGKSKLCKWSCGCTNVWCGVSILCARCMSCGQVFERAG